MGLAGTSPASAVAFLNLSGHVRCLQHIENTRRDPSINPLTPAATTSISAATRDGGRHPNAAEPPALFWGQSRASSLRDLLLRGSASPYSLTANCKGFGLSSVQAKIAQRAFCMRRSFPILSKARKQLGPSQRHRSIFTDHFNFIQRCPALRAGARNPDGCKPCGFRANGLRRVYVAFPQR